MKSYENENIPPKKLAKCGQHREFEQHYCPTWVQKSMRIVVHNTMTFPIFLQGSEIWALKEKDKND